MTTLTHEHATASHGDHGHHEHHGPRGILNWLTSTDHKVIGLSYTITSVIMLVLGGALAEVIRGQLANPNGHLVSFAEYNQLFTMHGSIMIYLFAGPFAFGALANIIVPIQIGAPDMAFPRLNALSYWLYLSGAITMLLGFFTSEGAANFGWVAYTPLSDAIQAPGYGTDLWIGGLILTGFSAIFTGVNICATVFYLRAPGMTLFRMPIFTWNLLVVSILILLAFPVLTAGLVMLYADRHFGTHIYSVAGGGVPVLWQHIFWFWGHPEVYILALPFFGMVTEIIPVFSKKPVFGYKGIIFATISIAALSLGVWAHHMFTTGVVLLPFFSIMSLLIAVPTGIKIFNWIGTMWRGSVTFDTPMIFSLGFLVSFVFGGLTGVILASPPLDFALSDSYFVVAHFHYVLFGTVVFAMFAGFYFWWPKLTGKMLDERLGKIHFWLVFFGFHTTFLIQHWLGVEGMARRYADYLASDGFTTGNVVSTIGSIILGISTFVFGWNVYITTRFAPMVGTDDPGGWGNSLEWATSCPPPRHNFHTIPRIRSERPAFDLNHPEAAVPVGVGPAKDAPDAPVVDVADGEVK